MALPSVAHLSADEYLSWESKQPDKHEYLNGEVFAMVGATRKHVTVAGNVFNLLSTHLEASPCRVYISDMKLRVEAANAFFYPDVFVTCNELDHQADAFMTSPILIVEVLSASTNGYDRGEKFAAYRKLPSLKEYILIDPERQQIECFRRNESGLWVLYEFEADKPIEFESVGLAVAFSDIFKRVEA
jgi:Uma2 family endonuclease